MKPARPRSTSRFYDLVLIGSGYKPPNRHKWGPGVRDLYAFHYIISGKGYLETQSGVFEISRGESFVIFPYSEVYYYPDANDPWEYVWVEFIGDEVPRLMTMMMLTPNQPVMPVCPVNLQHYYPMDVHLEGKPHQRMRSDAQLRLLLSYYMEYYSQESLIHPTDYVVFTKAYIEQNYWKTALNVADIAQAVKLERSYLFRLFKRATGMSVAAYLAEYRIRRACDLLRTSGLSIKTIAYSVGYNDPLYFSRRFREVTSYTPSAYRTLHAGRQGR